MFVENDSDARHVAMTGSLDECGEPRRLLQSCGDRNLFSVPQIPGLFHCPSIGACQLGGIVAVVRAVLAQDQRQQSESGDPAIDRTGGCALPCRFECLVVEVIPQDVAKPALRDGVEAPCLAAVLLTLGSVKWLSADDDGVEPAFRFRYLSVDAKASCSDW